MKAFAIIRATDAPQLYLYAKRDMSAKASKHGPAIPSKRYACLVSVIFVCTAGIYFMPARFFSAKV